MAYQIELRFNKTDRRDSTKEGSAIMEKINKLESKTLILEVKKDNNNRLISLFLLTEDKEVGNIMRDYFLDFYDVSKVLMLIKEVEVAGYDL